MIKSTLKQIIKEELGKTLQNIDAYKSSAIRGIQKMIKDNPQAQSFVGEKLIELGKEELKDLDTKEAFRLNTDVRNFINQNKTSPSIQTSFDVDPGQFGSLD